MEKIMVVILLSFLCYSLAFGAFGIQPGINLGLNMANMSYGEDLDDNTDKSSRMGINGGAALDIMINESVYLESGVYYTMKGCKTTVTVDESETDYVNAYDYLTIPIKVKVLPKIGLGKFRPFISVGPEIGLLMSAKKKNGDDIDIKDNTEDMDFGLYFGAGLEIPISEQFLVFQAGYCLGLMDINKLELSSSIKNNCIYIMTGMKFPL